jgi:hypothetical protein
LKNLVVVANVFDHLLFSFVIIISHTNTSHMFTASNFSAVQSQKTCNTNAQNNIDVLQKHLKERELQISYRLMFENLDQCRTILC